jgi:hypothetical protein
MGAAFSANCWPTKKPPILFGGFSENLNFHSFLRAALDSLQDIGRAPENAFQLDWISQKYACFV